MGRTHALVYQGMSSVSIVGIVDSYLKEKEVLLENGLKIPVFSDLESALPITDPTFVDLCVPTDLHVSLGLKVFEAGKHLFCEKPIALDLQGATLLEEARQKAGVQAMVGHCIRFWPEYRFFAKLVREKTWGALRSVSFRRYAGRPQGAAQNWVSDPARCNGAALDLHIHDTDFILSLLGTPESVTSRGIHESSGWNWIATDYHYQGVVVRAEGGWNLPASWGFEMSFRAVFEKGAVDYSTAQTPAIRFFPEAGAVPIEYQALTGESGASVNSNLAGFSGYVETLKYFVNQIEKNQSIEESTLSQAMESLKVTLAEIRSAQEGKSILIS